MAQIKVELTLVAIPLPEDRVAAYWEGMRILAKLIRLRAAELMTESNLSRENGDGGNG